MALPKRKKGEGEVAYLKRVKAGRAVAKKTSGKTSAQIAFDKRTASEKVAKAGDKARAKAKAPTPPTASQKATVRRDSVTKKAPSGWQSLLNALKPKKKKKK